MQPNEYVELALRTEPDDQAYVAIRGRSMAAIRGIHAALGICTEAGEFADAVKRFVFYGKELDKVNAAEELGDLMWYVSMGCDEIGVDLETVMKANIDKLSARYPSKFTIEDALNRNLKKEREVLEG